MVTIFGDSLTGGRFGVPYRRFLEGDFGYRGIDGQTTDLIMVRLRGFLRRFPGSTVVAQGGGNDIISICRRWGALPQRKPPKDGVSYEDFQDWALRDAVQRKTRAFLEKEGFEAILAPVLERARGYWEELEALGEFQAEVHVCSVSALGEEPGSLYNRLADAWNGHLASKVPSSLWIDLKTPMEGLLSGEGTFLGGTLAELLSDRALIAGSLENANQMARGRGLGATVDGLHPNEAGARAIAGAFASGHFTFG